MENNSKSKQKAEQEKLFLLSSPPYIRNGETSHCLMFDVFIASFPIVIASVYFFGLRALWIIAISCGAAMLAEALLQIFFISKDFNFRDILYSLATNEELTLVDGSALITGMLLAFTLPSGAPLWLPAVGSIFAILIGKHAFGGLGYNIFNPALVGRAFLLAAWPIHMTAWNIPLSQSENIDAITSSTPLALMKMGEYSIPSLDLFIGNTAGSLGETSIFAIILGSLYLLYKRTITWHIPLSFLGSFFALSLIFNSHPISHILSGGIMLGAFFMATDVVTSPITNRGKLLFGCGIGIITFAIRMYGGYPEGVCYAILIMNSFVPLIDKFTSLKVGENEVILPMLDRIIK